MGVGGQQNLSGTIVLIIIAIGVQACIILFIFVKRQIQRFALRNRRGPHTGVGHGAPRHLRHEIDRLLEYATNFRYEPPLESKEGNFRHSVVFNFQLLESCLAGYGGGYVRPPGTNVRSYLLCCLHGPLAGIATHLIHQVCDEYDAARHHFEEVTRDKCRIFQDALETLYKAIQANKEKQVSSSRALPPSPQLRNHHTTSTSRSIGTLPSAVSLTGKTDLRDSLSKAEAV